MEALKIMVLSNSGNSGTSSIPPVVSLIHVQLTSSIPPVVSLIHVQLTHMGMRQGPKIQKQKWRFWRGSLCALSLVIQLVIFNN